MVALIRTPSAHPYTHTCKRKHTHNTNIIADNDIFFKCVAIKITFLIRSSFTNTVLNDFAHVTCCFLNVSWS